MLKVVHDSDKYTAVRIHDREGQTGMFILSNAESSASAQHELKISDTVYRWSGPFFYPGLR